MDIPDSTLQNQETELVARLRQGDAAALEQFYRQYVDRVYSVVFHQVGQDKSVAEDIVQETFLNVYKNLHQFDLRCSFKSWLFAIANNCKISYLRKQRPRPLPTDFVMEAVSTPDDIVAQQQEVDSIWEQAARLSECQYTALWLRYKEQMDVNQIARVMQKSRVHVRVLLHRARTRLAEDLVNQTRHGHPDVSGVLQGR